MRLIDADALEKKLHNFFDGKVIGEPAYILRDVFCHIDSAQTIIWCSQTPEGLPLMDLRERPKGEWIVQKGEPMPYICPFCNERNCCKGNYCPDCGADMRGAKC